MRKGKANSAVIHFLRGFLEHNYARRSWTSLGLSLGLSGWCCTGCIKCYFWGGVDARGFHESKWLRVAGGIATGEWQFTPENVNMGQRFGEGAKMFKLVHALFTVEVKKAGAPHFYLLSLLGAHGPWGVGIGRAHVGLGTHVAGGDGGVHVPPSGGKPVDRGG